MTAVRLDRRLQLEALQSLADGAGGYSRDWVSVGTLWGEVRPGAGREAAATEVYVASVTYRITVRAAPVGSTARPSPDQRLRDGSRLFTILAVSERDEQGHYLTCITREELPT